MWLWALIRSSQLAIIREDPEFIFCGFGSGRCIREEPGAGEQEFKG